MLVLTDGEIASLAQRPLDELSDDELALVAERALENERERRSAQYDHCHRLALQHLREVISDAIKEIRITTRRKPSMEFITRQGKEITFNPFSQQSIAEAKAKAPGDGVGPATAAELLVQIAVGNVTSSGQLPSEYRRLGTVVGLPNKK